MDQVLFRVISEWGKFSGKKNQWYLEAVDWSKVAMKLVSALVKANLGENLLGFLKSKFMKYRNDAPSKQGIEVNHLLISTILKSPMGKDKTFAGAPLSSYT
jgi:hypothetical protein